MTESNDEFLKWIDSAVERELWSNNYDRSTRDEYIAHRVWLHFSEKLDKTMETLSDSLERLRAGYDSRHVADNIERTLKEVKKINKK